MKLYLCAILLLLSGGVLAEIDSSLMDDNLRKMVQANIIGPEEALKAHLRLQAKKKNEVSLGRAPASLPKHEVSKLDLNKEQMNLIRNEMMFMTSKKRH